MAFLLKLFILYTKYFYIDTACSGLYTIGCLYLYRHRNQSADSIGDEETTRVINIPVYNTPLILQRALLCIELKTY